MIAPTPKDVGRLVEYRFIPGAKPHVGKIKALADDDCVICRFGHSIPTKVPCELLGWAPVDKSREAAIIDDILGAE